MWMMLGLVAFFALSPVAVHDDAAGDRAIGAGVAGFGQTGQLEGPDRRRVGRSTSPKPSAPSVVAARPAPAPFINARRESSIFIAGSPSRPSPRRGTPCRTRPSTRSNKSRSCLRTVMNRSKRQSQRSHAGLKSTCIRVFRCGRTVCGDCNISDAIGSSRGLSHVAAHCVTSRRRHCAELPRDPRRFELTPPRADPLIAIVVYRPAPEFRGAQFGPTAGSLRFVSPGDRAGCSSLCAAFGRPRRRDCTPAERTRKTRFFPAGSERQERALEGVQGPHGARAFLRNLVRTLPRRIAGAEPVSRADRQPTRRWSPSPSPRSIRA